MSWSSVARVGEHQVYDVVPGSARLTSKGLEFGKHCWTNPLSKALPQALVEVFIPVGGLSGLNKAAIVKLASGHVEVWTRT